MSKSQLQEAGLRVTVPRLRVLQVLEEANPHHLSAEDVYKKLLAMDEAIGLATVYRVLTQFESVGIVERHNFAEDYSVYELTPESHHDHMVDVDHGTVIEFVDEKIEQLQHEIAEQHGYELIDHELVLYVRKKSDNSAKK